MVETSGWMLWTGCRPTSLTHLLLICKWLCISETAGSFIFIKPQLLKPVITSLEMAVQKRKYWGNKQILRREKVPSGRKGFLLWKDLECCEDILLRASGHTWQRASLAVFLTPQAWVALSLADCPLLLSITTCIQMKQSLWHSPLSCSARMAPEIPLVRATKKF